MKIVQSDFFSLLSGITQYQIPLYQRRYKWGKDDCKRLMEDIIKAGTPGNPSHYIGSVIIKDEPAAGGVNIYNVIDGQQRTTTITLLLLALERYWTSKTPTGVPPTTAAILGSISSIYLTNSALSSTSLYTKLLPKAGNDRNEYENLLRGIIGTGAISANYQYFYNELISHSYNPAVIFDGINNAQMALVTLNSGENPQLLFEAVNDTGVDLTNVDLVRNWIHMGLPGPDQDRLYRAYWEPMESSLGKDIGAFLRYYTEMKSFSYIPSDYYKEFKKAFILNAGSVTRIEALLKDIKAYADIYLQFTGNSISNKSIQTVLNNIIVTGKWMFTPFILKVLMQWKDGSSSAADVERMLVYLESYIVRRDILGVPTNSLNQAAINFLKNSNTVSDLESCIKILPSSQYMPDDTEMHTQLQLRDFYNLSNSYYYLERMEKSVNPAFALSDPTIEHILPETMHTNSSLATSSIPVAKQADYNWELDLGANANTIHDTYQHTIGNLTILPRGENARMGNYRFSVKKNWKSTTSGGFNYGYLYTPIRISQSLGSYVLWDDTAILKRCKEMVDRLCNVWPHP